MERGTRSRTTTIKSGDSRVVGFYEQTADWPSTEAVYATAADRLDGWFAIRCDGCLDAPRSIRYSELVALAEVEPDGTRAVSMTDLLAVLRLETSAEVLLVTDAVGVSMGVPIRDVVTNEDARLVLGSRRYPLERRDGFPARLDIPGWTDDRPNSSHFSVASIRAITFREFIGCP